MQSRWQQSNLTAILRRLAPVHRMPPGVLFEQVSPYNHVVVRWARGQLSLCYRHARHRLEEIESRLNPAEPLVLLSEYTRTMLLALAWQPAPRRLLLVGLGGGRLQMVLHHYLERAALYTVEIDPVVVDVARRFFGVAPDARHHIIVKDGRDYVRGLPPEAPYDMILLDAYQVFGIPRHLRTREFYAECRRCLAPHGAIITNLQQATPLYHAALKTFSLAFRHVATFPLRGGNVVAVGSDAEALSPQEVGERARAVEARYGFHFALPKLARAMAPTPPYQPNAPVLSDRDVPGTEIR
jgi:spermidine synthase